MDSRPYQLKALSEIRYHYATGTKKVLLHLATGGGKTHVFCKILKGARERGTPSLMVVRGVHLIDQASQRLDNENVPHGVMQAGHWRRMPEELIQVCSIDTLYRRKLAPPAKFIVIDEAHLATSDSFKWLCDQYPDAYFLAVTATPWTKKGLRHIADEVVKPITMKELIEQGYLVPARYLVPSRLDLSEVKIDYKTADYHVKDLAAYMKSPNLFGDIVKSYKMHGEDRPALAFAVDIDHSKMICESFMNNGFTAVHLDANTPINQRKEIIKAFENREVQIISSVGVLTTGVDIPSASCIIMARPTKSYNLYLQILGRGTRPAKGKDDFLVLDHANNILEHGLICAEKEVDLDGKDSTGRMPNPIICEKCFTAFEKIDDYVCPECGFDNKPAEKEPPKREAVVDQNYELVEFTGGEFDLELAKLFRIVETRGYNPWWVYHQIKRKFGDGAARQAKKRIKEYTARQFNESDNLSLIGDAES